MQESFQMGGSRTMACVLCWYQSWFDIIDTLKEAYGWVRTERGVPVVDNTSRVFVKLRLTSDVKNEAKRMVTCGNYGYLISDRLIGLGGSTPRLLLVIRRAVLPTRRNLPSSKMISWTPLFRDGH